MHLTHIPHKHTIADDTMFGLKEFDLIRDYLSQYAGKSRADVMLGIGDDAALLAPPADSQCVASMDSYLAGVHFFANDPPDAIGYKSLAAALSDLAAMGAAPAWVMLAISLPETDDKWLSAFCQGFARLIDAHHLQLIGGDVTQGALSITWQVTGFVPIGQAITRAGAQVDDVICVTGNQWGEAGLALAGLKQEITPSAPDFLTLKQALYHPEPRLSEGMQLRGAAHAAIDISDGLLADLSHMMHASGVGAEIQASRMPISEIVQEYCADDRALALALTAGDEYELCFTLPESALDQVLFDYQVIGRVIKGQGVRVLDAQGEQMNFKQLGYQHFE